jgi:hypothetical protein
MSVGAAGPLVVTYIDDAILHPIAERFGVEVVIEVGRGGNDSGFGPAPSGLETPLAAPGGCLSRLGFAAKADSDRPRLGLGAAERVRRFQKALDSLSDQPPHRPENDRDRHTVVFGWRFAPFLPQSAFAGTLVDFDA